MMLVEDDVPKVLVSLQVHALGNDVTIVSQSQLLELRITQPIGPFTQPFKSGNGILAEVVKCRHQVRLALSARANESNRPRLAWSGGLNRL